MRGFILYLRNYLRNTSLVTLFFTILFTGALVVLNYTFGIERRLRDLHPWYLSLGGFLGFYLIVFFSVWGLQYAGGKRLQAGSPRRMVLLMTLGPLYFALKMLHWDLLPLLTRLFSIPWNHYALITLQIPAKLLLLFALLWFCWKTDEPGLAPRGWLSGYGLTAKGFRVAPYFLLLAMMIPLVALASTRPDFLHTYPKVKNIAILGTYTKPVWPWQLVYELSYGLDFLNIELFFRGLLVIGLSRYAGEAAILPMAAFYCTIHFGKPLGECISSFFGGLILGVLAYRSRSVLGGLIVHLGLAWMMEVGGWLGNYSFAIL